MEIALKLAMILGIGSCALLVSEKDSEKKKPKSKKPEMSQTDKENTPKQKGWSPALPSVWNKGKK